MGEACPELEPVLPNLEKATYLSQLHVLSANKNSDFNEYLQVVWCGYGDGEEGMKRQKHKPFFCEKKKH